MYRTADISALSCCLDSVEIYIYQLFGTKIRMAVAYVEKKSRKKPTFVLKDIGKLTEYAECAER